MNAIQMMHAIEALETKEKASRIELDDLKTEVDKLKIEKS